MSSPTLVTSVLLVLLTSSHQAVPFLTIYFTKTTALQPKTVNAAGGLSPPKKPSLEAWAGAAGTPSDRSKLGIESEQAPIRTGASTKSKPSLLGVVIVARGWTSNSLGLLLCT